MVSQIFRAFLLTFFLATTSYAGVYEDIIIAANEKDTDQVIGLLRRGMDVNTADRDGSTLLLIAARTGNEALAGFLLDNRASLYRANRHGDTPILAAAAQGEVALVERFLAAGAELNPKGWTPLHYASYGNHKALVSLLIHKGAEIELRAPNGYTAAMLAAISGRTEALKELLMAGADRTAKDVDGTSIAAIARTRGFEDAARMLESAVAR